MKAFDWHEKKLTAQCPELLVEAQHATLLKTINTLFASQNIEFSLVMERGGWHHLGGVVDGKHKAIASSLRAWAESESDGDVDVLMDKYTGQDFYATRLDGRTLYFTASTGDKALDYLQLEIEVMQEMLDRPLFDPEFMPDNLEEFLDPMDFPRLENQPVGQAYYRFRRLNLLADVLADQNIHSRHVQSLLRFVDDWSKSSAGEAAFCEHWVMVLHEYHGSDKVTHYTFRPTPALLGETVTLPHIAGVHGSELAKTIHGFDRQVGYPFAWYFFMLTHKGVDTSVAEDVLRDQMGAYDYLPARDLKLLRAWEQRPYSL